MTVGGEACKYLECKAKLAADLRTSAHTQFGEWARLDQTDKGEVTADASNLSSKRNRPRCKSWLRD